MSMKHPNFCSIVDLFILSTYESPKIKVNQVMFCNSEPQLSNKDAFQSEIAYSFDSSFSSPKAGKDPPFSMYIECF